MAGISTPQSNSAALRAPPTFIEALTWARETRAKSGASVSPEEELVVARFEALVDGLMVPQVQATVLRQLMFLTCIVEYLMLNTSANMMHRATTTTQLVDAMKVADRFFTERAVAIHKAGKGKV